MPGKQETAFKLRLIITGGQTGVDQAALRSAMSAGILCAGWCPPDRSCEDGPIPADLPLTPTPTDRSPSAPHIPRSCRTEWNVRDSDATLVLLPSDPRAPDPGTEWTIQACTAMARPLLVIDPTIPDACDQILDWLSGRDIRILNIAGPSERTYPGIGDIVKALLDDLFGRLRAYTAGWHLGTSCDRHLG
ncbi:MAG: putative molybdenum carrier protein [Sedimentisphaerales bacterium]|nr:putative molybdenum carrier protein [Sedimentisphaerales bacterium]